MIELGVTYETITKASASVGDYEETGWEWPRESWKPGMLRERLQEFLWAHVEPSSSDIHQGMYWIAFAVNEGTREWYETDIQRNLGFHISGATDSTLRRINKLLRC